MSKQNENDIFKRLEEEMGEELGSLDHVDLVKDTDSFVNPISSIKKEENVHIFPFKRQINIIY